MTQTCYQLNSESDNSRLVEIEVAEAEIDILPLLNCSKLLIIFFIKIGYWIFFCLTLGFINVSVLFQHDHREIHRCYCRY